MASTRKRVAIIGFAGGHVPVTMQGALSRALYQQMIASAQMIITARWSLNWSDVELVSGGAPWGDHVAVSLYLLHETAGLTIFAPCTWLADTGRFVENEPGGFWANRSGVAENLLHTKFSSQTSTSSFDDLKAAVATGAIIDSSHAGFKARNQAIAQACDYLIAFSWSNSKEPSDGGTLDTWSHTPIRVRKVHVPMASLAKSVRAKKRKVIEDDDAAPEAPRKQAAPQAPPI